MVLVDFHILAFASYEAAERSCYYVHFLVCELVDDAWGLDSFPHFPYLQTSGVATSEGFLVNHLHSFFLIRGTSMLDQQYA